MSKFKFAFTNIFLWLGIISSCLLIENHAFLTATPSNTLPDLYFYMLLTLALSSYLVMFLFEHIYNKTKIDLVLVAILGLLLGGGLIAIWAFKDMNFFVDDPSKVVSLTNYEKARLSIGYSMFILTMYAILFIFSKNHFSLRSLRFLFVIVIGIVYFCIIYSLFAETESYKELVLNGHKQNEIVSLFWNTNVFSGSIVMGICAAIVLNIVKKNAFSYVTIIIFYIELFFTGSTLSLLTATGGITLYFLAEIFLSMKKHMVRSFIFLSLLLVGIVTLITLFAFAIANLLGPISKVLQDIYGSLQRFNYSTMNKRVRTWTYIVEIVGNDPIKLTFGVGYDVCNRVINNIIAAFDPERYTTIVSAHSGVMQILLCSGVVGLFVYALFLFYFFYAGIRLIKHDKRFATLYMLVGSIMLLYSFGESVIFFNCNVQGILVGVLFYLPLIMRYKHIKHPEVCKAVLAIPYDRVAISNNRAGKIASFFIVSLLCALSPIIFMDSVRNNVVIFRYLIMFEACLGVLWLFLPYLVCQWHKDTTLKHFKLRLILNVLFIVVVFSATYILYYLLDDNYNTNYVYAVPSILAGILLIDAIYYSIIRKTNFKDLIVSFISFVQLSLLGALVSVGGTILILHFYQSSFDNGLLIYIIVGVFSMLTYYAINLLFMNKEMKYNVTYINNVYITLVKRQYLIENSRGA